MKKNKILYLLLLLSVPLLLITTSAVADDLILSGQLSGNYQTDDHIYTQGSCTVQPSSTALLEGGLGVTLNPGFVAESDSTFTAIIPDDDSLLNWWEFQYLGTLSYGPNDDPDIDGLTNLEEFQIGTDPNDSDTDDDGLTDGQEVNMYLTDPLDPDTDNDGMPDGWEVQNNLDPLIDDAADDPDTDELTNLEEYQIGTDPNDSDTDNDGMPDGWETQYGLNPLSDDSAGDRDNDGHRNILEYIAGTNPDDENDVPPAGNYYSYDELGRIKWIFRVPNQ